MSAWAYVQAAAQAVANLIGDPQGLKSGVRYDGKPPASFGQLYYAIWWPGATTRSDGTIEAINDVDQAVTVTITKRLGYAPDDRQPELGLALGGLVGLAEAVAAPADLPESAQFPSAGTSIAGSYATMYAANALIPRTVEYCSINGGSPAVNGYTEPLWLLNYGPAVPRPASWVWAKDEGDNDVYSIDIRFVRGRRLIVGAPQ